MVVRSGGGQVCSAREEIKMLRISQIKLNMDEPVSLLPKKIGQKLRIKNFRPDSWSIVKESVDAREKPRIRFIYTVDFTVKEEEKLLEKASRMKGVSLTKSPDTSYALPKYEAAPSGHSAALSEHAEAFARSPEAFSEHPEALARSPEALAEHSKALVKNSPALSEHPEALSKHTAELRESADKKQRPVIVGFGPCGMFAALILAEAGLRPIVLERGRDADRRTADVERFWKTGQLDITSNVQFGEGGAGTFSDGKLTTGIKDARISKVKEELIEAGADPAIAYRQMPHVGTDVLRTVVKNIREKIICLGGEVRFESQVTGIRFSKHSEVQENACGGSEDGGSGNIFRSDIDRPDGNDERVGSSGNTFRSDADKRNGSDERAGGSDNTNMTDQKIEALIINGSETLPCSEAVFSPGNSARDTFRMLYESGVHLEAKPFSVGVRIEHPQAMIDTAQYGFEHNDEEGRLGAASYKLSYKSSNGRGVYTFCMCPGGYVVGATSCKDSVVTNGMSYHDRSGKNANSALLVDVHPEDYPGVETDPLAGIRFQEEIERRAYEAGGGGYFAPVQFVGDFLAGRSSLKGDDNVKSVDPTYRPGVRWTDLSSCLPDYVIESMREALPDMARRIAGFDMEDAVMTGVETRSSSPVRIPRMKSLESVSAHGLYPGGEGAGYAGGIMSAAVDGIKIAEKIIERRMDS